MNKQTVTLLIIVIFLFALTVRLQGLGTKITTPAEDYTLDHFKNGKDLIASIAKWEVTPPLYFQLAQVITFVTRIKTVYMIQLISVFAGALTSIVLFFIAKETIGQQKAFIAMFLFSIYPTSVLYSQYARSYALVILLAMFSTYFFINWLKKGNGLAFFSLANLLLIYTHYLGFTLILSQLVLGFVMKKKHNIKINQLIKSTLIVFVLFLPLTLLISEQMVIHKEVTLDIKTQIPIQEQRFNQAVVGMPLFLLSQAVQLPTGIWFCKGGINLCFQRHVFAPTIVFLVIALMVLLFAVKGFLKLSNENKKLFGITYFTPMIAVLLIISTSILAFAVKWVVLISPLLTIFIANELDSTVKKLVFISGWIIILTYYFFAIQPVGIIGAGIP